MHYYFSMRLCGLAVCIFLLLSSALPQTKSPCDKGNDDGSAGCPDPTKKCKEKLPDLTFVIPVTGSKDPNEIIGPQGYDSLRKWVSVKATLPYKILFENDPDFATAPAQKVIIYMPIPQKLNPNALRLGDFGFGNNTFTVPPNTSFYTKRLDVSDSTGVLVDVTAGLDVTNRRAFWIFESIDPGTGLAGTLPANSGFLPVNDSTRGNGEGFVTLTLQADARANTRDSVTAIASIIFDINEPLETNIERNIIDAKPPASSVKNLPSLATETFTVSWSGKDDSLGAGLKYYDLYVSKNNGPFSLYKEKTDSTSTSFTGERGATYGFYTLATDYTGNREAPKAAADQTTVLKSRGLLVDIKAFLSGPYQSTGSLMTDSLRAKALVPSEEPYSALNMRIAPVVKERIREGVLDSTGNKAITDWVLVELRKKSDPKTIVSSRSALLRRDGKVVDMDGDLPVYFNGVPAGDYFVALRHRNHLGVSTASALPLAINTARNIDFTLPSTPVYGVKALQNISGVMALWAGDSNGSGIISYNGAANDKNIILSLVGLATPNNVVFGYYRSDCNLDGKVNYNGAGNDKNKILGSVGLTTPNNVITEQLPK